MSESNNYPLENQENKTFKGDWSAYYSAVSDRPPRDTLLAALARLDSENATTESRFAIDLGCGEGRDTVELLRRGWRVLAIDGEAEAISRLLNRPSINREFLETRVTRFENLILPGAADLINASFSLPFSPPEFFPSFWEKIVTSVRSGGYFCGQLFGDRDSWAVYTSMSHHTREQVEALLKPFEVEMLQEEDHPGQTAIGEEKHWHIFHIVARKK